MVVSPRNTDPKSLKNSGSYHETTKQIKLATATKNFRLLPIVIRFINGVVLKMFLCRPQLSS